METGNFITESSTQSGRKLESVENKVRDIFIQCLVFNKTIIPFTLVRYELMIADSSAILKLPSNACSWNDC